MLFLSGLRQAGKTTSTKQAAALKDAEIQDPYFCEPSLFSRLLEFGGFPMPYLKQNTRHSTSRNFNQNANPSSRQFNHL
jgi:predicted AAA+ superfamily ATPase